MNKRLNSLIVANVCLLMLPVVTFAQLPTPTYGWNLGNTLEPPSGEGTWNNPPATQGLINAVADAGFNTIRIPVAWDSHANQTTYVIDSAWLARVKEVVDYCYARNLYVIINCHWDNGWLENNITDTVNPIINAKQNSYWTQIANTFVSYDDHLLFAGTNEPAVDTAGEMSTLLVYEQTFVNAVRATGGSNSTRWLVVQGPNTDIDTTYNLMNTLPTDPATPDRLMVEVHYYTPWQFCGLTQDEGWGSMFYFWGQDYHSDTLPSRNCTWGEESWVDQRFQMMTDKFVSQGIPVILGEFGSVKRTTASYPDLTGENVDLHIASRTFFDKYIVDYANSHGLHPFYWDNGDVAGGALFNRYTNAVVDQDSVRALTGGAAIPPPGEDTTPPAAPTGLSATGGESQVSLNWSDNSELDLAGYNVYRSTTSGSGYVKINGPAVTSSAYTDNNVDGYVTYYYVVRAVDISLNESGNSNQASATPTDTTAPAAPTGLTASAGDSSVSPNWLDNGEGDLAGYNVYRSTTSGSGYSQINGSLVTSSDYIDNTVTNGITYYYVVTAVDTSSNESNDSSEVYATPSPITIYTFAGITAANTEYNAYACDVDVFPFGGSSDNRNSMVEATDQQYIDISADNTAEWVTLDPGSSDEVFLWIEMKINESPASISRIDLTFNGNTDTSTTTHRIYVMTAGADWTQNSSWTQVGSDQSIPPDVDTEMTRSITSDISSYIDGTGRIIWGVYETTSSEDLRINYLEMTVAAATGYSNCGEVITAGYRLAADINGTGDCYVDYYDLDTFVDYWLNDTCTGPDNCHGSDFVPTDGVVDFFDFSDFAMQWLVCNDPSDPDCPHNW